MRQAHAILEGELLSLLPTLPDDHFDAVLCDPPYHLTQNSRGGGKEKPGTLSGRLALGADRGFMDHTCDGGDIAFRPGTWEAVMRAMKPGAYPYGSSVCRRRMMIFGAGNEDALT